MPTIPSTLRRSTAPARWPMPLRRAVPQRRFPRWHRPVVPLLNYDIARDNSTPSRLFRTAGGILTHNCLSGTSPPCWSCASPYPATALVTFAGIVERGDTDTCSTGCPWWLAGGRTLNRAFCCPLQIFGGECWGGYTDTIAAGQVDALNTCDYFDVNFVVHVTVGISPPDAFNPSGSYRVGVDAWFTDATTPGGSYGADWFSGETGLIDGDFCAVGPVVVNNSDIAYFDCSQMGKLGTATVDLFAGCTP